MHQLARALVRPWWPVTLAMLLVVPSRRLRPVVGSVVAGIVVTAALRDRARHHRDVAPMTFVACRLADDVAYGTGVWLGCLRERTLEPAATGVAGGPDLANRG